MKMSACTAQQTACINLNRFVMKCKALPKALAFFVFTALMLSGTIATAQVTVAGSTGANGTYPSLTKAGGAFAAINANATQTGNNITISITADVTTEDGVTSLNAGNWTTITVSPSGARTISGTGVPMINFNGADNVTINGLNTGGNSLIINNTSASTTSNTYTIRYIADATNNTVTNCTILCQFNSTTISANGGCIGFSTGTATGNDNNTVSNCNLSTGGTTLTKCINGNGSTTSAAIENSGITINNCNIYDYFVSGAHTGIYITTGNQGWTITNNRFYQTTTKTLGSTGTISAIFVSNTANTAGGFTITGNTIGYASNTQTGTMTYNGGSTFTYTGISFTESATASATSSISNNIISDIAYTGTSTGSSFTGISNATSATSQTETININSNTVKNIAYAIITTTSMVGISAGNAATLSCNLNTINNITRSAGSTGGITGITTGTPATSTFSNNTINSLAINSTVSTGTVAAINISGGTTTNVFKNKIYDLSTTSTSTGNIAGIIVSGGTTNTISNNLIGDLKATAASSADAIRGINITSTTAPSTQNIYYNTVYLNASSSGATFGTSGIFHTYSSTSTTSTLVFRNNIIVNNSTPNGTGLTVAFRRSAATDLNNYSTISNNNLFYTGIPGSSRLIYYDGTNSDQTLAAFKTRVSTREANSKTENPPFLSTTGTSSSFLHINTLTPTQIESGGSPVSITDDYDGDARNATTPDMGADEFAGTPAVGMSYVSSTTEQLTGFAFAGNSNQSIVRVKIVTTGSASPISLTNLNLNANGTTNITDIDASAAKVYYTGPSTSFSTSTLFGSLTPTIADFTVTGTQELSEGDNYFWLAYDVIAAATSLNVIDGECTGMVVGGSSQTPGVTAPSGNKTILGTMSGVYLVGASQTFPNFTNVTNALADLHARGVSAAVTFKLQSDYSSTGETFPLTINAITGASAVNTITFQPNTATAVTISGSSSLSSIFKLNGADFITIDGLNTAGASLTLENTSTTAGSTVVWIASTGVGAGATNNTIKNSNIKGGVAQNTATTNTYGIVVAGSTLSATFTSITAGEDNDNNTIATNTFTKLRYGIYFRGGSTTNPNNGTVISNNIIGPSAFGADEIGKGGIVMREEDGVQITGNSVQFVGGDFANTTAGTDRVGIAFTTDALWPATAVFVKNAIVTKNNIHDVVDERTFSAAGIAIGGADGTNATNNLIANNFVSNIKANGTSSDQTIGIGLSTGNGDKVIFNSISLTGDTDPNASASTPTVSSFGISISSTSVTNPLIRNNIVNINLTSSSASTLKNAAINIPASFVWGTGNSNYNDLYAPAANTQAYTGAVGGSAGTFHLLLSAWQTASIQDANSISVQPVFTSATDLHLVPGSNAGIDNLGTPAGGITTDVDNDTRSVTTPDMGADEFSAPSCTGAVGGTANGPATSTFCGSAASQTVTASGYSTGIGSTYQWQSSTDNFSTVITDIGGQTNPATLATGAISVTTAYRLKVTCTSGTAEDYSNVITITINPNPTVSITPAPTATACGSQLLSLDVTSASGATYAWKLNGNAIGGATSSTYTAITSGSYTLTVSDGVTTCSGTSAATAVTINAYPSAITITPASATICEGASQTLTASGGDIVVNANPTIGAGNSVTTAGVTTSALGPNPLQSFYGGAKQQMLILASELNTAGLSAGSSISAIGFTLNAVESRTLQNYVVKMQHLQQFVMLQVLRL
jgi:hypothetical protein